MNTLENRAHLFALRAHQGQTRKWTNEPYIIHPERVAKAAKELGLPEEAVAAALLHDVIEDCEVKAEELHQFGVRVLNLVLDMTDPRTYDKSINRKQSKEIMNKRLTTAMGNYAICLHNLKLLDGIDNAKEIKIYDPDFWVTFKREKTETLQYATEAYDSVKRELADILEVEVPNHPKNYS